MDVPALATKSAQTISAGYFTVEASVGLVTLSVEKGRITEDDVRSLEVTRLLVTVVDDEWISTLGMTAGATLTQALINGLMSSHSEPSGWGAMVGPGLLTTDLKRLDATTLSIGVPQFARYAIDEPEVLTLHVPAGALRSGQPTTAAPSIVVEASAGSAQLHGPLLFDTRELRFQMHLPPPSLPPPSPLPSLPPFPPAPPFPPPVSASG